MVHVCRLARTLFVMGSPGRALRHQRPQATQLAPRLGASPAPVPTLAAAQPAPASHSSGRSAALGRSAAAPLAGRNAEPGRGALRWTQLGSRSRLESRFSTCESLPPASVRGFARSRPGNGTHLRRRVPRALLGKLLCRPKLLLQRADCCISALGRGAGAHCRRLAPLPPAQRDKRQQAPGRASHRLRSLLSKQLLHSHQRCPRGCSLIFAQRYGLQRVHTPDEIELQPVSHAQQGARPRGNAPP